MDRTLIDRLTGAELRPANPLDAGTVLVMDKPWEGAFSGYFTILKDGGLFRMYHRGVPNSGGDGRNAEVTCYAESPDGIRWTKPELGLHQSQGSRANNLILADAAPYSHNFCPMLDSRPGTPRMERFKALAGLNTTGLAAFSSADGIHWQRMSDKGVIPVPDKSSLDSQNLAFWPEAENKYVAYYRTWKKIDGIGYRWISRSTSDDFLHWTRGEQMDFGDAPSEHLYTNQTSPYFRAPHIYISICARFFPGKQVLTDEQAAAVRVDPKYFKDVSDAVLMTRRGGPRYERTFLDAFPRPGTGWENWVSRSNYPALNIVQTGPTEMSLYVTRNYGQPTHHIRRYTMRLDGFASVHSPYKGGELVTKPLVVSGSRLELNYATSAAGGIRVEIQNEQGIAIPGFAAADAAEITGDEISRFVTWKGSADVRGLAGKTVRLRFVMKDSDLYAMQFR